MSTWKLAISGKIISFLKANNLEVSDVDAIVLGFDGNAAFEKYYSELAQNAFAATTQL